jgi:prepilin-type N-terminal cleavage/methylation domain-containing protein
MGSVTRRPGQHGFSLIEVMVGAVLLAIGLLAVVSLVDTANRQSAATESSDGATALAREVLERARGVPFGLLVPATLPGRMQALPGLEPEAGGGWRITRAGVTYAVTVSVCSIDDPSDGIGARTADRFCVLTVPPGPSAPAGSQTVSGIYADLGLLDTQVSVALTGNLLDTVCNLAGPFRLHLAPTVPLLSAGADVLICPTGSQVAADRDAEDVKRIAVDVAPPRGRAVRQSALVTNPDRAVGPA